MFFFFYILDDFFNFYFLIITSNCTLNYLLEDSIVDYRIALMVWASDYFYPVTCLLMRPLWYVFTCVWERTLSAFIYASVFVAGRHRVDLNNNVLGLHCTWRKGMNSNVKCLLFIHYGWNWHRMGKTGGIWDHVNHTGRSNKK